MWQQISNNPQFTQAFGGALSEDWFNSLPQKTKDELSALYASGGTPSLMLDFKPDVDFPEVTPEPQVDNNQGFLPVTVNAGQSNSASLLYNPQTGGVRANGMAGEILLQNEKLAQELAREAYNQSLQQPVKDAAQKMETAEGILQSVPGDPSGDLINVYNDAKSGLAAAQASADQNYSAPDAVNMVGSRVLPQTTTPTMTGLEGQEFTRPVLNTTAPVEQSPTAPVLNMPGYTMPSAMQVPKPVLVDTTEPAAETVQPTTTTVSEPILRSGGQGRSTGALSAGSITSSSGPKTSNARGSMMPQMLVDRNEALIRIGGAMYSGALKGDGIGAATQEYGRIQDENREQSRKMAEAEQKRQMELARLRAARAGGGKSGSKGSGGKGAGELRFGISKLNTALDLIKSSEGSLTGWNPSAIFSRFIGKTVGNEEEAQRLFLNEIGLDQIMTRVAETKGAISNAEMALFGRQVPQLGSQEIVWERWLQRQIQMSEVLLNRLENGGSVDPNAPLSETMPGMGGGVTGTSNGLSQEDLDYINQ